MTSAARQLAPRAAVELDGAELALGQLVAPVTEGALRELHDVALVHQRQALALVGDRVLERRADQALAALARDRLDADAGRRRESESSCRASGTPALKSFLNSSTSGVPSRNSMPA